MWTSQSSSERLAATRVLAFVLASVRAGLSSLDDPGNVSGLADASDDLGGGVTEAGGGFANDLLALHTGPLPTGISGIA
jgi:hypothetical protein